MIKKQENFLEKEKEIFENKYTILNNRNSKKKRFSDDLLPKSKIYPLIKDSMWKCMMNFERPQYVSYLISSLFDLDYNYVLENLREVNFVLPKNTVEEAMKTVDFVCKIDDVAYILEANNYPTDYTFKRNLDYLYKVAGSDRESGKNEYTNIKLVNIDNFSIKNLFKEDQSLYHAGLYGDRFIDLGDNFEIRFISLPFLARKWYTICKYKSLKKKRKKIRKLKDWEKFFLVALVDDSCELDMILEENKFFREYREEAKKMTKDEYQHYMDLAVKANEKMYRQMAHDAEARGKTEGIALGEESEKVATARRLHDANASMDIIKTATGFSESKIKSICL